MDEQPERDAPPRAAAAAEPAPTEVAEPAPPDHPPAAPARPAAEPDVDPTRGSWRATTHDWGRDVDHVHLAEAAADPTVAAGGVVHLVLEVLAYAADEAVAAGRRGRVTVTRHADASITVADDGRGTDTRLDSRGRPVRKPVMATADLRFHAAPDAPVLADGRRRRGMSVVAATSPWLVHRNRRADGAWEQRYHHGVPVGDLVAEDSDGTTGTSVRFLPRPDLAPPTEPFATTIAALTSGDPALIVTVRDDRRS